MKFTLIVAVYTALGGTFDKPPHVFAEFNDPAACEAAATHVESKTTKGFTFVAVCKQK